MQQNKLIFSAAVVQVSYLIDNSKQHAFSTCHSYLLFSHSVQLVHHHQNWYTNSNFLVLRNSIATVSIILWVDHESRDIGWASKCEDCTSMLHIIMLSLSSLQLVQQQMYCIQCIYSNSSLVLSLLLSVKQLTDQMLTGNFFTNLYLQLFFVS